VSRALAAAVTLFALVALLAAPAVAQVTVPEPTTEPPTTQPPATEPPTTQVTVPPTTRPRSTTTRATSSTVGTTTTVTLLPPPSVVPQDPAVPPSGSNQSDHISSTFLVLPILGFVVAILVLVAQWFLTRPGRRGWTF
jgi:cobalamin biosynthesis Mg chelatase CobN